MTTSRNAGVWLVPIAALVALGIVETDAPKGERGLAQERGCLVCHAVEASPPGTHEVLPSAPSFQDIARRYRGNAAAPAHLASVIRQGSGRSQAERHWAGQAAFSHMFPNEIEVSAEEAQRLARWILDLDRRARPA